MLPVLDLAKPCDACGKPVVRFLGLCHPCWIAFMRQEFAKLAPDQEAKP